MEREKKILLIVTGGVAVYKSLELMRLLIDAKIDVLPVMTSAATKFVTPLSFSSLCNNSVYTDLWEQNGNGDIGHIELSRQVDLIVVAPATANLIAKMANGIADDLATNVLLAANKNNQEICQYIGAKSLKFLSINGMYRAIGFDQRNDQYQNAFQFEQHRLQVLSSMHS